MSEKLQQAAEFYRKGDRRSAFFIFQEEITANPNNYQAWYGLALCLDAKEQKIDCLNRVLKINPKHEKARRLLDSLTEPAPIFTPPPAVQPQTSMPIEYNSASPLPPQDILQQPPNPGNSDAVTIEAPTQKPNILRWLLYAVVGLATLVVLVVVLGVIQTNKTAAAFQEDFDTFYKEAIKLEQMTGQGVAINDFRNQLADVKASYTILDGRWTKKFANSKTYFDQAIEGWSLTLNYWSLKISVDTNTSSLLETDEYYSGTMKNKLAKYLKTDIDHIDTMYFVTGGAVGYLMSQSSDYFELGKSAAGK